MSLGPRAVFGMPAYNRPDALPRALESLLSQTYTNFGLVIVDDAPSPEVEAIIASYADPRIVYEPNPNRLGMVGNWRKAFDRGRALFPGADYFAWVSDHDMWHPRWLEVLIGVLDANVDVVGAYPLMQRVFPNHRRTMTRRFDTSELGHPVERLRAAIKRMTAGNCVYGLFRADALAKAGVFRPVLAPDRHVLMQLLLLGRFAHVPEVLWYREVAGVFSYSRQRRMFFPTHVPLHTYLPMVVQHSGLMLWEFGIKGRGLPSIGRFEGARYGMAHLWYASLHELLRNDSRWRLALDSAFGRRSRNAGAKRPSPVSG